MNRNSKQNGSQTVLVILQFAGILVQLTAWFFSDTRQLWWMAIPGGAGTGLLLFTLWFNRPGNFAIRPTPRRGAQLVTTGPYGLIRHPMYAASFLIMLGFLVSGFTIAGVLGYLVMAGGLFGKMKLEEELLMETFPDYKDYRKSTAKLIPGIW
jgi:protein-S-isoprenylcysteine O-methyltransferase Ste14